MRKAKKLLSILCAFMLMTHALSEEATPSESIPSVRVRHMLETLSGGYTPAEDTKEEPNPEYLSAAEFSESLSALKRDYPGFKADEVEARKDDKGNYVSADVKYRRKSYTLMIDYVSETGEMLLETHTESVRFGEDYSVRSPSVSGYVPGSETVSGAMGAGDKHVTVVYTAVQPDEPDEPIDPSTPTEPDEPDEPIDPSTPAEPDEPDEPIDPSTPAEPDEPDEPIDPSTPTEPDEPDDPIDPSTPTEPDEPDDPIDPSTPTEPDEPDDPIDPSTPTEPDEPDEPIDPSTPTEPDEPDDPIDPSTPTEPDDPDEPVDPSTPTEPDEPATPSEPVTPSEPATPSEPGFPPGGGRPGGGRPGGGFGQAEVTISPGEAATSYHAMGKKDVSAHWQGAVSADEISMTQINLDGGSAVIAFSGDDGEAMFAIEQAEEGVYVLTASGAGTWDVNGFAFKILKESGFDTLILRANDTEIRIDTSSAAASDAYAILKSQGVGERRMAYRYHLTDAGECIFALYADGEYISDDGRYVLSGKEEDAW